LFYRLRFAELERIGRHLRAAATSCIYRTSAVGVLGDGGALRTRSSDRFQNADGAEHLATAQFCRGIFCIAQRIIFRGRALSELLRRRHGFRLSLQNDVACVSA
jgi:hypothetical protein